MAITLRQLAVFRTVAETGHATRASETIGITQSAVSMAIAELERLAGAPLFERKGRKLLLNDRGRHILPDVIDVLEKVSRIERYLDESLEEPVGVLKVGASTTIGNYLLPLLVGAFERRFPRARALLEVANTKQIETAVESGEYDVGLVEGPPHSQSLKVSVWREDELVVIVGREHPLAKHPRTASAAELEDLKWIMRESGSGTREVFEKAMHEAGLRYDIGMVLGHTEAIKKAVEAGLGVGCLSRLAVQREILQGWLIEVATPLNLQRNLYILTQETGYTSRLLSAYLALLEGA
ncbi:LysR substrate-binding domain-containing protein [Geomesophilobacter sediminis]|uniref:LysR family transcriptional regulator n=1 Tax=Geomesophilobacter sediminis TaxID=2798584 RepID=A0A8J7LTY2_9BACT|nr:LysR substrate-binding domain-containing protein [Geomesophilobacter sediminis]MBJ6723929.1 LysR family transcriptional regulator [Geomesophilobacter sediminis]